MNNEIIIFENQNVKLEVNMKDETVWLSLEQIAQLFDRDYKSEIRGSNAHVLQCTFRFSAPCFTLIISSKIILILNLIYFLFNLFGVNLNGKREI